MALSKTRTSNSGFFLWFGNKRDAEALLSGYVSMKEACFRTSKHAVIYGGRRMISHSLSLVERFETGILKSYVFGEYMKDENMMRGFN